jgi:hypothetical protein
MSWSRPASSAAALPNPAQSVRGKIEPFEISEAIVAGHV